MDIFENFIGRERSQQGKVILFFQCVAKSSLSHFSFCFIMDLDVVEIPPPIHQHPPRLKKQSIVLDVIDIDDGEDDDDDDLMVIGQISRKCNKGKVT